MEGLIKKQSSIIEIYVILIKNNITPVVTLHHFTHPIWFEDIGAFEKKENIDHFIEFSELFRSCSFSSTTMTVSA